MTCFLFLFLFSHFVKRKRRQKEWRKLPLRGRLPTYLLFLYHSRFFCFHCTFQYIHIIIYFFWFFEAILVSSYLTCIKLLPVIYSFLVVLSSLFCLSPSSRFPPSSTAEVYSGWFPVDEGGRHRGQDRRAGETNGSPTNADQPTKQAGRTHRNKTRNKKKNLLAPGNKKRPQTLPAQTA